MPDGDSPVYAIYGIRLTTDFRFENAVPRAAGPANVRFDCTTDPPKDANALSGSEPVSVLGQLPDGQPFQSIHRDDDCDLIRYSDVADFYVRENEIACWLRDPEFAFVVEIYLLGFVLSYWLERMRATPALHAAAVVVQGRAVAFLASNKGGKTSLAASMMHAGHPLLTDDILAIEPRRESFYGLPGYPQMRMWPQEAEHFLGHSADLALVHRDLSKRRVPVGGSGLGRFHGSNAPLARIYVPNRYESRDRTEIEILPMRGTEALLAMIENSFVGRTLEALDGQAARLRLLGALARSVPVRRLTYPSGMRMLPRVVRAVEADVQSPRRHGIAPDS